MAVDMFLKIEGIKGESADDKHKEDIDVLAWSWGVSNSGSMHMGGGGGTGKANFQDFSFTMWQSKASPVLMLACATGKHIPKAEFFARKAGGKQEEYFTIEFTDLLVSAYSAGGSGGEDRLTENITLNFAKFKMIYKEQKKEGGLGAPVDAGYDIKANKKV